MSKQNRLYVDVHVLQTVPPSCVNRDDTGSPKTAIYGGVRRARVSSQAWKHSIRLDFKKAFSDVDLGLRTKKIVGLVAQAIQELDASLAQEACEKKATVALENAGLKIKDVNKGTDALFFISSLQAKELAGLAVEGCTDKNAYKNALKQTPSIDMALFGRMVAADPSLNYDAAAQVAHAISTHAVSNEYDYFTAVDDCSAEDNAGAGHLGTVEYNSATLYRYATVNISELANTLEKGTPKVIREFVSSFIRTMPTGKQNTFANRTLPDAVYVTIRTDQPVNLSGAFERPVQAGNEGYVAESVRRLVNYTNMIYEDYHYAEKPAWAFTCGAGMSDLAEPMPFPQLLDQLESAVKEFLVADKEA